MGNFLKKSEHVGIFEHLLEHFTMDFLNRNRRNKNEKNIHEF